MKRREIKIRLLLLVSMLILAVGVVPHHHHYHKDAPCFHPAGQEAGSHDPAPSKPHHCTCIDSFYAAENQGHTHHEPYCNHFPTTDLLADLVTCCLFISGHSVRFEYPVYREPLHGIPWPCAFGLRAPPVSA